MARRNRHPPLTDIPTSAIAQLPGVRRGTPRRPLIVIGTALRGRYIAGGDPSHGPVPIHRCWVIRESAELIDAVDAWDDAPGQRVALAQLVALLHQQGLTNQELATAFGIPGGHSAVSRMRALAASGGAILDALARGRITAGHVRHLARLPESDRTRHLHETIRNKTSVRDLAYAVQRQAGLPHDVRADVDSYANELSERVGATVAITARGKSWDYAIEWHNICELRCVLEALSKSRHPAPLASERRELRITGLTPDEAEALFGPLARD